MYWLIIGPLVVLNVVMLGRLWYVAGTAPRVGADARGVAGDRSRVSAPRDLVGLIRMLTS